MLRLQQPEKAIDKGLATHWGLRHAGQSHTESLTRLRDPYHLIGPLPDRLNPYWRLKYNDTMNWDKQSSETALCGIMGYTALCANMEGGFQIYQWASIYMRLKIFIDWLREGLCSLESAGELEKMEAAFQFGRRKLRGSHENQPQPVEGKWQARGLWAEQHNVIAEDFVQTVPATTVYQHVWSRICGTGAQSWEDKPNQIKTHHRNTHKAYVVWMCYFVIATIQYFWPYKWQ